MNAQEVPIYPPEFRRLLDQPKKVERIALKLLDVWSKVREEADKYLASMAEHKSPLRLAIEEVLGPVDGESDDADIYLIVLRKWQEGAAPFAHFLADYANEQGLDHIPLLRFADDPQLHDADALAAVRDVVRHTKLHAQKQLAEKLKAADGGRKPRRRGAPGLPKQEQTKRVELLAKWERAKTAGVHQKDFADDEGITCDYLDRIVNWATARRNRAEKSA